MQSMTRDITGWRASTALELSATGTQVKQNVKTVFFVLRRDVLKDERYFLLYETFQMEESSLNQGISGSKRSTALERMQREVFKATADYSKSATAT